jgi:hypothetical protein
VQELERIVSWLTAADDAEREGDAAPGGHLLTITGSPGTGKSALLARAVVLSDPERRPPQEDLGALPEGTVPPAGSFDGVVWCHNKSLRDVTTELATILGGSAPSPDALVELARQRPATIAVDALDEAAAGDAAAIARDVLRPLAEQTPVRLLVGTRRRAISRRGRDGMSPADGSTADGQDDGARDLLDHLGTPAAMTLDLDTAPEHDRDLRRYLDARLTAVGMYADERDEVVDRIADAAAGSFLVASLLARTVGYDAPHDALADLPSTAGGALAVYLDRVTDTRARELLRPLAWSQGAGLPWGSLWPALATALARAAGSDASFGDGDVDVVLDAAAELIVETLDAGQPVYRLFHELLAEEVRRDIGEAAAHDAIAAVLLAQAPGDGADVPWSRVARYVRVHLPHHLLGAGRYDELVAVLTDPGWERARREETADPLVAVNDVEAAISAMLAADPTDVRVVPLCVAHSRAMTTAPPLVIDVLARDGQLARAEAMAANLTSTPDRILAYRLLAAAYASFDDLDGAERCVDEVERSLASLPSDHLPMGYHSLTRAALDAGATARAGRSARQAVDAAFAIEDEWDRQNGLFWAALACREAGDEDGRADIRAALDEDRRRNGYLPFRNQALQAAAAAGHVEMLREYLAEGLTPDGNPWAAGNARPGNLALAFADAGMSAEFESLRGSLGDQLERWEADSAKRGAWALAIAGRVAEALDALGSIHHDVERGKAVARIAEVALSREDRSTLAALIPGALELLDRAEGVDPRTQARMTRVLWLAGERTEALARAERLIGAGTDPGQLLDPRDGSAVTGLDRGPMGSKAGRREMVSTAVPVADEQRSQAIVEAAQTGNLAQARRALADVEVPVYRARALAAIARAEPDPDRAVADWLQAMASAWRAGTSAVDEVLTTGDELLRRAGREEDTLRLQADLDDVGARWA